MVLYTIAHNRVTLHYQLSLTLTSVSSCTPGGRLKPVTQGAMSARAPGCPPPPTSPVYIRP